MRPLPIALLVFTAIAVISSTARAQKKSLVIGIDGLGFGAMGFSVAETPNIDRLINGSFGDGAYQGAYSDRAFAGGVLGTDSQQSTVSGPGWSTILTGVWTDLHHVTGNSFSGRDFAKNPPYLGVVKAAFPSLTTASFVNWTPIDANIIAAVDADSNPNNDLDYRLAGVSDATVVAEAVQRIGGTSELDPDLLFIALDDVDHAGHTCGSSGTCYRNQIEKTDGLVGDILEALQSRPQFTDEDWQIIVTSDHGHQPGGGHGGQSEAERRIPLIVASQSLRQGTLPTLPIPVSHADVVPTVLDHFGLPLPERYAGLSRAAGAVVGTADINRDGVIFGDGTGPPETDDVTAFSLGWKQPNTLSDPNPADINLDAIVDLADFTILRDAIRDAMAATEPSGAALSLAVPEPSSGVLALLAIAVAAASRFRQFTRDWV